MAQSTYLTMTAEHLGQDATETDLRAFKDACERVMQSRDHDRDAESSTDFVWNDGRILFEADTCVYCERVVRDRTIVPNTYDAQEWHNLSLDHDEDCEWIVTRAHQLP